MLASLALAAAVMFNAAPLSADYCCEEEGLYIGLVGGWNVLSDETVDKVKLDFDSGWMLGGSVGYRYDENWKAEFEVAYRENDIDKARFGGTKVNQKGSVDTWSYMINGFYQIDTCYGIYPELGAGIGFAHSDLKATAGAGTAKEDGTDFAYQLMAGLVMEVTESMDAYIQYRFMHILHDDDLYHHTVGVGLRHHF